MRAPLLVLLVAVAMTQIACTGCGEYNPQGKRVADTAPPTLRRPVNIIGSPGSELGQFAEPRGFTFADDGSLWIADFRNYRVQVLSPDFSGARAFGEMGNQNGEFNDPAGIALAPNGDVVVCDTWNNRVQVFTRDGVHRFTLAGMVAPRDAVVAENGEIFVTDSGNCKVRVYGPDGAPLREWGECGPNLGQMLEPVGIDFDQEGNVCVADNDNARIQIFDRQGRPLRTIPVSGWVKKGWREPYLAHVGDGTFVVTVPEMHKVLHLDSDGEVLANFGGQGGEPGQFQFPTGVDIGPDGKVYVMDTWNHRIQVFDLS